MPTYIMRIVPRGLPSADCGDDYDESCDLDEPHDLTHLEQTDQGEVELERIACASGHEASRLMCRILSGGGSRD